jgi:large subunit ribosomal protein L1
MKKHSKMYVEALGSVEKNKEYDATEAIKVLKGFKTRKFDETVDLALKLNIDAKKTDMNIRGSFVLPNGTGKAKRVLVITKTKADEAKDAEYCGAEDMLEKIEKENWFDFDTIIATPEMMPALGKLGKVLGPKGLMPNPKLGTVTTNVAAAIDNVKKGMVEYKNDSYGNVHVSVGKLSFDADKLEENVKAIIAEIVKNKPTGVKGTFVKNVSISSTMSPGIKISLDSLGL